MDPDEIEDALDILAAVSDNLTPWEQEFLESVAQQWDEKATMSTEQQTKLAEIQRRYA